MGTATQWLLDLCNGIVKKGLEIKCGSEMIQAAWDTATQWLLDLCNGIVKKGLEIKCGSTTVQSKSDPVECGSYRGIKLLELALKVVEKILSTEFGSRLRLMTCSLDS